MLTKQHVDQDRHGRIATHGQGISPRLADKAFLILQQIGNKRQGNGGSRIALGDVSKSQCSGRTLRRIIIRQTCGQNRQRSG